MPRMINVEFTDGTRCEMIPAALDLFLSEENWVRRFERSSGWVWVGFSQMRKEKRGQNVSARDCRLSA